VGELSEVPPPSRPRRMLDRLDAQRWPLALAVLVSGWNLWDLRATLRPVAYPDDASIHEQMVRFATAAVQAGHDPLGQWFPYLGAGSPQFLHYQSLGAMLTGVAGALVGGDTAFRWSLYLLVALWPLVIYLSARLLRLTPWAAAAASVLSPVLMSVPSVGYERGAYLWIGYGLWAQLWASWFLPLAWATTWRAVEDRRFLAPAALSVALTACLHFETGFLAFAAVVVLPFVVWSDLRRRIMRAAVVLVFALLGSSWAVVPLIAQGKWASINEVLHDTPLVNGYGAGRVLSWLIEGRVYDAGRFPVVTLLVLAGVAMVLIKWRSEPLGRAVLVLWAVSLLMSFGRTTFGSLVDVIPGSSDLFFRRFLMGAQLAGLYLGATGAIALAREVAAAARWALRRLRERTRGAAERRVVALLTAAACVGALVPVYSQVRSYDLANSENIDVQRARAAADRPLIAPLLAYVEHHGDGRTYAGLPTNWGENFTVGGVSVFKYLESQDIDEIGYTLRTASLMTDPESFFDQSDPGDYVLFGVRYLILPTTMPAPVPARPVMTRGPYRLFVIPSVSYLSVLGTVGIVTADRSNIAARTLGVLHSSLVADHRDLVVAFAGAAPAPLTGAEGSGPPGRVLAEHADLAAGRAEATVRLTRRAVIALSASFDPGWQVRVDGHPRGSEMLAPATVGVAVGPGTHTVSFVYRGFPDYPQLFVVAGASVLAVFALGRARRRRGSDPS